MNYSEVDRFLMNYSEVDFIAFIYCFMHEEVFALHLYSVFIYRYR